MQAAFAKLLQSHFDCIDKDSGLEARRVAHAFSPGFTKTLILEIFRQVFVGGSCILDPQSDDLSASDMIQRTATAV